ncbi:MAG TPA: M50 family metallopeptidase [Verrucomicrobiae bacterium]|nr:M50 family metallopeptidase [Verrucomicrobiae bacterium]
MPGVRQGSLHLFRFAGIDVFLHWSWFLVAVYEIQSRAGSYSSITWNVLEYLALFLIVTLHEFGHALACRQVGGRANRIVLWPLGGVAFVDPPPRPGATLWSIAAGPLVNVVLIPILLVASLQGRSLGYIGAAGDFPKLIDNVYWINKWLLIFNILPIYPLDGGQILRSLLWFVMGRARSLMAATVLGLIGATGFVAVAFFNRGLWLGAIAAFMLLNCWTGLKQASLMLRLSKAQRREGVSCPSCGQAPPAGDYWHCGRCGQPFDAFATDASCPFCSSRSASARCTECGAEHPAGAWAAPTLVAPTVQTSHSSG